MTFVGGPTVSDYYCDGVVARHQVRRLAYQGREGCQSGVCRAVSDGEGGWRCVGWHCAVCHEPSSYQGHGMCPSDAALDGEDE